MSRQRRQTQQSYKARVLQQLLDDLQYPVNKDGSIMDTSWFKAAIAMHLVRAGWRKPNNTDGIALREGNEIAWDDPEIKPRKVYGPGVFEDAITWVSVNEPDDPLDDIQNMTMSQIDALPDDLRIEAKRRLGLIPREPQPDPDAGWSVKPLIHITDEEDPDDGTQWI